jgi:hypothetical protein
MAVLGESGRLRRSAADDTLASSPQQESRPIPRPMSYLVAGGHVKRCRNWSGSSSCQRWKALTVGASERREDTQHPSQPCGCGVENPAYLILHTR